MIRPVSQIKYCCITTKYCRSEYYSQSGQFIEHRLSSANRCHCTHTARCAPVRRTSPSTALASQKPISTGKFDEPYVRVHQRAPICCAKICIDCTSIPHSASGGSAAHARNRIRGRRHFAYHTHSRTHRL